MFLFVGLNAIHDGLLPDAQEPATEMVPFEGLNWNVVMVEPYPPARIVRMDAGLPPVGDGCELVAVEVAVDVGAGAAPGMHWTQCQNHSSGLTRYRPDSNMAEKRRCRSIQRYMSYLRT